LQFPTVVHPVTIFPVRSATSKASVILCVDNEELPLKIRREVLSRQGYQVLSAHSGESALRMFRDNHVDLVISDNRLPDLAGTDIIAEMKHLQPSVPIMMLSGVLQAPPGAEIADSFITKGMSTEAFLAAVANLLKRRVTISANTGS
jgi:DNA-binding response OmpR family regulator